MRSYPIWNNVQACIYQSSKSWGAKDQSQVEVVVGTSAKNSHKFVTHKTTHRTMEDGTQEFRFYVDGVVVKTGIIEPKKLKSDCVLSIQEAPAIEPIPAPKTLSMWDGEYWVAL